VKELSSFAQYVHCFEKYKFAISIALEILIFMGFFTSWGLIMLSVYTMITPPPIVWISIIVVFIISYKLSMLTLRKLAPNVIKDPELRKIRRLGNAVWAFSFVMVAVICIIILQLMELSLKYIIFLFSCSWYYAVALAFIIEGLTVERKEVKMKYLPVESALITGTIMAVLSPLLILPLMLVEDLNAIYASYMLAVAFSLLSTIIGVLALIWKADKILLD